MSKNNGVTRRRLVQGAAWSVPAIAIAAPAMAANCSPQSPCGSVTVGAGYKVPGESCKKNGYSKGYAFSFTFCNQDTVDDIVVSAVTFTNLAINGQPLTGGVSGETSFTIAKDDCVTKWYSFSHTTSENATVTGTVTFTYTRQDGTVTEGPFDESATINAAVGACYGSTTDTTCSECPPDTGV